MPRKAKKDDADALNGPSCRIPRDLNAPRRPPSAYFLFASARRKTVAAANPGQKASQIAKVLGEQWKALGAAEKKKFEDEAREGKEKYKTELAEYQQTDLCKAYKRKVKEFKQRLKEKRKKAQREAKARAAWAAEQEARDGRAGDSVSDMSDDDEEKEEEDGDEDDDEEEDSSEEEEDEEEKEEEEPLPPRPKPKGAPKRALSGYLLFSQARRKEVKDSGERLGMAAMSKKLGAEWRALDEAGRRPYIAQAEAAKAVYATAMANFKKTEAWKEFQTELAAWTALKRAKQKKGGKRARKGKGKGRGKAASDDSDDDDDEDEEDEDGDVDMASV